MSDELIEYLILRAFDRWPAYHPDAVAAAMVFPETYQRWCDEVTAGKRVWIARHEPEGDR